MAQASWKRSGRRAGYIILLAGFLSANHGMIAGSAVADAADHTISFANDDPAMNEAQEEARGHLDRFLATVMQDNGVARGDAAIKVAMPTDAGHEVIWVTPFAIHNGTFLGRLANEPQEIPGHAGDTVHFSRGQVRDWSFMGPDRRIYGSFTTRALLPHLDPNQAEEIAAILSDNPLPTDW